MSTTPVESPDQSVTQRRRRRGVAAAVLGALVALFSVLNLGDVKVHWLITTAHTPLIIVILLSALFGIAIDRLVILRGSRRRKQS